MTPERLQVILRDDDAATLEVLTADGRTRTEVVHRALSVLRYVEETQRDGSRIFIRPKEGTEFEVRWP